MTVKLTSGLNLPSFFWRTKSKTLLDKNVRLQKEELYVVLTQKVHASTLDVNTIVLKIGWCHDICTIQYQLIHIHIE